jgi:hypothetical protein
VARWPRALSLVFPLYSLLCAPPDAISWSYQAENEYFDARPKHTSAWASPSRPSPSLEDIVDDTVTTTTLASIFRTSVATRDHRSTDAVHSRAAAGEVHFLRWLTETLGEEMNPHHRI